MPSRGKRIRVDWTALRIFSKKFSEKKSVICGSLIIAQTIFTTSLKHFEYNFREILSLVLFLFVSVILFENSSFESIEKILFSTQISATH